MRVKWIRADFYAMAGGRTTFPPCRIDQITIVALLCGFRMIICRTTNTL